MRIFVIAASRFSPDSMEKHVFETLCEMEHVVECFNVRDFSTRYPTYDRLMKYAFRNLTTEPERLKEKTLVKQINRFQPDFILVLLGNMVSPKTIAAIRKTFGGKIVCWCQDQLTTMGRQYLIGCEYDIVYVLRQW